MSSFGEQLVNEFYGRVQAYVRLRVPERDSEDLIADTFLRAIERREQLKGSAAPWLLAIARSRVAGYYRARGSMMQAETEHRARAGHRTPEPTPLERLTREEFHARLHAKMALLSDSERDVIAFKFTEGLTNAQIAGALGIPANRLGVMLHRALARLREAMLADERDR